MEEFHYLFKCTCMYVCMYVKGPGIYSDGLHEAQALVHLGGHLTVSAARGEILYEVQVPGVQARDVGVSTIHTYIHTYITVGYCIYLNL